MRLPFFDASAMIGETIPPLPAPLPDARSLLDEMDHFGIEQSLFFHYTMSPEGPNRMNSLTLQSAKTSERLVPCWILQTTPAMLGEDLDKEAQRIAGSGVKAARLFPSEGPSASPAPLRTYFIGGILAGLERYRIPLLIPEALLNVEQLGSGAYDPVEQFCAAFPQLPVVILEPRYNSAPLLMPLLRRYSNLYVTITLFALFHQLESMVEMTGAEHFVFGTGLPRLDASIATGMLLYSSLQRESLELIAGGNLRRLLANAGREGQ